MGINIGSRPIHSFAGKLARPTWSPVLSGLDLDRRGAARSLDSAASVSIERFGITCKSVLPSQLGQRHAELALGLRQPLPAPRPTGVIYAP
jgi:hypothetical protein